MNKSDMGVREILEELILHWHHTRDIPPSQERNNKCKKLLDDTVETIEKWREQENKELRGELEIIKQELISKERFYPIEWETIGRWVHDTIDELDHVINRFLIHKPDNQKGE